MKRNAVILILAAASLLPGILAAQSQFWLSNRQLFFGVDAPVFDAAGNPLVSSNFVAELWGGGTADSLSPALAAYTLERVIVPFGTDPISPTGGYFRDPYTGNRGSPTIFSVKPYFESAWLQVRAWDTRLGATYEDVVAAGLGGFGESPIFSAVGSSPFRDPPDIAYRLIGLQSFSLRAEVPEPSPWILLAFGGGALCWALRRRPN